MTGIIYSYEHNGKLYVGKTYRKERKRKNQHKYDAYVNKLNTPFANAIRKYGWACSGYHWKYKQDNTVPSQ